MHSPNLLAASMLLAVSWAAAAGAESEPLTLTSPIPWSVAQRVGYDPLRAGANEPGGPALGFAELSVRGAWRGDGQGIATSFRALPLEHAFGEGVDWTPLDVKFTAEQFSGSARLPAGGWYRLEVKFSRADAVVAEGVVEPIGVGEVFLIAGQSYATNTNDERLKVSGEAKAVSAYDSATNTWRLADDPQPTPDGSDGGSIWPAFGDLLAPHLRTPVGLVNVAVGGTSSEQWLPGGALHGRLIETGKRIGRFRAVLWQQGESDVIAKTTTEQYVKNVQAIRDEAIKAWGFEPPWILAKSTLHPTVYDDPAGENRIRLGIDELSRLPGFRLGPDTDALAGENRGGPQSRRHFSAIGQRRAAELWFVSAFSEIQR